MGILIALLFAVFVHYADQSSNIQLLEFDLETITATDFTIELKISQRFYFDWKDRHFDSEQFHTPGMAFKRFLKDRIENLLTKHNDCFDSLLSAEETANRQEDLLARSATAKLSERNGEEATTPD